MMDLHLVVAGSIRQRTGGYLYDAQMVDGLRARGRDVSVHELLGTWPAADATARAALTAALRSLPDGALVLVDGLVGGMVPDLLAAEAARLQLIALVHHPLCDEVGDTVLPEETARLEALESRALALVRGVVVTSAFTQRRVIAMGAAPALVRVVEPGTERVSLSSAERVSLSPVANGGAGEVTLLCVGSVTPRKGQLQLVDALGMLKELPWRCEIVGSLARHPAYAAQVAAARDTAGLRDRVALLGELDTTALADAWARADLFVLPSRYEGYGMALTEAVVRGLPVVSTTGGAIPYTVPADVGRLVPPGNLGALTAVLRELVRNADVRAELASRSRAHAARLPTWETQVALFEEAVRALSPGHGAPEGKTVRRDAAPADTNRGDTFSSDWLTLREPADHAARSARLAATLADVGHARGWHRGLDLGSGRGSNLRWLEQHLPWVQEWVALDHDAGLLAELSTSWCGRGSLRTVRGDLAQEGLAEVAGVDVVTCSALLDLVSASWVTQLARSCAAQQCAALLALSWDGTASLESYDAVDGGAVDGTGDDVALEVLVALRAHQQGEKGMGAALGPSAPAVAAAAFEAVGMRVELAESPWTLRGPEDGALIVALVAGWVAAAAEIAPDRAEAFRQWFGALEPRLRAGDIQVTVGHIDLLALPAEMA